jgi:hypothetical protein
VATVLESDGTPNTTEWLRDHQAPVSEAAKATRDSSAVLVRDVPCVCAGCGRSKWPLSRDGIGAHLAGRVSSGRRRRWAVAVARNYSSSCWTGLVFRFVPAIWAFKAFYHFARSKPTWMELGQQTDPERRVHWATKLTTLFFVKSVCKRPLSVPATFWNKRSRPVHGIYIYAAASVRAQAAGLVLLFEENRLLGVMLMGMIYKADI